jgi:transposase
MGKPRFDSEFKKAIAKVYLARERTAPSLANEIGVHVNTIYKWAEEYEGDPQDAFPGSGHMKPEQEETRRLQRRVKELEE